MIRNVKLIWRAVVEFIKALIYPPRCHNCRHSHQAEDKKVFWCRRINSHTRHDSVCNKWRRRDRA